MSEHDHATELALYGDCITCAREKIAGELRSRNPVIDTARVGGGKVGRRHSTSAAAAARHVKAGSQQAKLLLILDRAGADGITCAAAQPLLADGTAQISRNQTATRMGELGERGFAERTQIGTDDGRPIYESRATDAAGNTGAIWRITDAGRAEANRLRHR